MLVQGRNLVSAASEGSPAATNLLRVAAHVIIPASPSSSTDYGNSRIHQAHPAEREESIHRHGIRPAAILPYAWHAPVEFTSARVPAHREIRLGEMSVLQRRVHVE
jgi:hypothetical protein